MPPVHLLILTICSGIILYRLFNLGQAGAFVQCGGKGGHRPDCPARKGRP